MLSTLTMVRLGKTYGNLMVDVRVTNEKLRDRATRIVEQVTGAPHEDAARALAQAGDDAKLAIVMLRGQIGAEEARERLRGGERAPSEGVGRMRVVGLMSGTSVDAIDAAIADITLEGDTVTLHPLGFGRGRSTTTICARRSWPALPPAPTTMEAVCRLDTRIGQAFAEVAVAAIEHVGPVDLIVSHGQTLYHWVEDGTVKGTLQLGQPAWIAERTHVAVVSDLRPRDVAAGGQGAPLVSLLDTLLLAGRKGRPAALNLGGIANLTVATAGVRHRPRQRAARPRRPRNSRTSPTTPKARSPRRGTVVPELLDRLLADPYYARPAPKSTGPEHFGFGDVTEYPVEDVLATLTELTARTVLDAARQHGATELIVSGGGVHNATLMSRLAQDLPTITSDALGLPAQDKEAYAFALLGFLTAHGLPGTLSRATGATRASVLGSLTPGIETGPAPRRLTIM